MRKFIENMTNVRWAKHLLHVWLLSVLFQPVMIAAYVILKFPDAIFVTGIALNALMLVVSVLWPDFTCYKKIFSLPSPNMTPLTKKSLPSFVTVTCHNGGKGSGFIVSGRHILTARHVVEKKLDDGNRLARDSTSVKLCYLSKNGRDVIAYRHILAKVTHVAKDTDMAVLTVPRWCRLRPTMRFSEGDPYDMYGHRISVGHIGAKTGFQVGYVKKWKNQDFFKDDVTDNGYEELAKARYNAGRGDSGGPVFTKNGEIIGIHTRSAGTDSRFLHIRNALGNLPDDIRQEILDDQRRRFS